MKREMIRIPEENEGDRLDVFLSSFFEEYSRSALQKLIREGAVQVDQKIVKCSYPVAAGDEIDIAFPDAAPAMALPEPMDLDIVYEDGDLLVVNKPQGMVVHPSRGHESHTLVNGLLDHCQGSLSGINGVLRPGIVHRIDKDTSGLLVVAKNDFAHQHLAEQLKAHTVTRRYQAVVNGFLREDGIVDAPLGRNPANRLQMAVVREGEGKRAVTHYHVLSLLKNATHIECRLETGRTHQIRVHMAYLHHPILGDPLYGGGNAYGLAGQALHAGILGFIHPRTGEYLEFSAELPEYFNQLLRKLS